MGESTRHSSLTSDSCSTEKWCSNEPCYPKGRCASRKKREWTLGFLPPPSICFINWVLIIFHLIRQCWPAVGELLWRTLVARPRLCQDKVLGPRNLLTLSTHPLYFPKDKIPPTLWNILQETPIHIIYSLECANIPHGSWLPYPSFLCWMIIIKMSGHSAYGLHYRFNCVEVQGSVGPPAINNCSEELEPHQVPPFSVIEVIFKRYREFLGLPIIFPQRMSVPFPQFILSI